MFRLLLSNLSGFRRTVPDGTTRSEIQLRVSMQLET